MTKNRVVRVSLHVNEIIQVQMGLSKCFTDKENSDLGYIMVEINWAKWRHLNLIGSLR